MGNIQPRLQSGVRSQMKKLRMAGGDTMNFWIKDFREELLATIRNWDFLLINDAEARMLSGTTIFAKPPAFCMGPHTLVIKRGEYGAMLFRKNSYFTVPATCSKRFRSDWRRRLFRGWIHRLPRAARLRSGKRPHQPGRFEPRGHLRLRHGKFLLREVRRGAVPHAQTRGDRCAVRRVPHIHVVLV